MYNTFISVVALLNSDEKVINDYLVNVYKILKENFNYFEIIFINNGVNIDMGNATKDLDKDIKKNITLINLSKRIDDDNAIVAGLDRANGDYTIIFDIVLYKKADLILELYKKTQENYDIVYLKYKKRKIPFHRLVFYKTFYYILKKYSDLTIDINMHQSRIISRRALNSITKVRESMRYMKGIFSFVGYNSCAIETELPKTKMEKFSKQFRYAMIAFVSFTDILNKLLIRVFIIAIMFTFFVAVDALIIKLTEMDIFGSPKDSTVIEYLVILVSSMFAMLFLILYIFSIYLSSINNEIKQRPVYFIESIQRIE